MGPQYKYKYKGCFCNLTDLAHLSPYRIRTATIARRLGAGWSVEEAVETPPYEGRACQKRKYECVVDGKVMGVTAVAKRTGVKPNTIYQRILRGETLQEVADNPFKRKSHQI